MTRLLCVLALVIACGGRPGATAHPSGPQASDLGPRPDAPATSASHDARDCDTLIAHAVALGVAERPPEQQLTAEERASIEAQLRTAWTPRCTEMSSRDYDCALAARSLAELQRCGG